MDDTSFDLLFPSELRAFSSRYWTPVDVARHAARLLRDADARRVLDVGAGVGKFALSAGAAAPSLHFTGIEQRPQLVVLAREAAERLAIPNVDFRCGDATQMDMDSFDAFYFFNPFAENLYTPDARFDHRVELSSERFFTDVLRMERVLRAASVGTKVLTYHGMGGRIPTSYELAKDERARNDWLRLWVKRQATDDGTYFLEMDDRIVRICGGGLRSMIRAIAGASNS